MSLVRESRNVFKAKRGIGVALLAGAFILMGRQEAPPPSAASSAPAGDLSFEQIKNGEGIAPAFPRQNYTP